MTPFVFSMPATLDTDHRVDVPTGINSAAEFLRVLDAALRLPDYFNFNWNSLEECVRDLGWFPERNVVVVHGDVPLINDPKSLGAYLDILSGAVARRKSSGLRALVVVFPEDAKSVVEAALNAGS